MIKIDEINTLYKKSNTLEIINKILFISNIFCSLLAILPTGKLKEMFILFQIIIALLYVITKNIDDGLFWYNAESARRKDSIQTAFNITLTTYKTEGYYNNEFEPSIIKYAVNTFESNYFSNFLSGKMLLSSSLKSIVAIIILIITGWAHNSSEILLIILQSLFSVYVIEDTFILIFYKFRMQKLFDDAFSSLITIGINNKKQEIWLLAYILEYESIKAHYKVRINNKIFNLYNDELSKKWNELQSKIIINKDNNY